ncbi:MAG: hypothetical protein HY650_13325 [Acidobacteria bacterium]|nr:hypothetical protein [Acidobacteriota bacterium]
MASPFWLNAVLRSLGWLGAVAFLAYLKKPDDASLGTVCGDLIGWFGGGLLVVGLALHLWSNVTLARGERAARHGAVKLVTDGPYALVHHAIYLAGAPLLLGTCLLYSQVTGPDLLAGLVLLSFLHLRVIRGEEPALNGVLRTRNEELIARYMQLEGDSK